MSNADMVKVNALIESVPEIKSWLTHVQNKATTAYDLYRFCQWAHKSPMELLALKNNPGNLTAERLLDSFVADEESGFTNSVKCRISASVKSFFKWNYKDLARASGAVTYEKVKPTNLPTRENLRKLWNWCLSPRDRALITFVASTAIAKGSIVQLKWLHLEPDWEKVDLPCINLPSALLKGHGRGRYKGVQQVTFLTPEAKRDLLIYREWIEGKIGRALTGDDNIFLNSSRPYEPLTYGHLGNITLRLSREANVPFSWHDARRFVNTALEQINISPNWARKIRGRKVRGEEAPYSRPAIDQLREKFKEAVSLLEFTTERQIVIPPEVQERLKALEDEQRGLKRQYGLSYRKIPELRAKNKPKIPEEPEDKKPDCPDGEHCPEFKQIIEGELLTYLKAGWQIEHNLANGQVIMRRD
jgi:integrase